MAKKAKQETLEVQEEQKAPEAQEVPKVSMVDVKGLRAFNAVEGNKTYHIQKGSKLSIPKELFKRLNRLQRPVVELD